MPKFSGINTNGSPALNDFLVGVINSLTSDDKVTIANILALLVGSTTLSSQLQSYTNAGSGGGTFYYINLGGIKLLWGLISQQTFSNGYNSYILDYPTSFFSTTPQFGIGNLAGTGSGQSNQGVAIQSLSGTTSCTVEVYSPAGSQASQVSVLIMGI